MSKSRTHEEYIEELKIKNPNVEVIGKYINARTKILHKCKIHNVEWIAVPDNILRGCGCSQCKIDKDVVNIKNRRKTHEQYVQELIDKNIPIDPLEEYVNCKTNILHKCKICGYMWDTKPCTILAGCGCPICGIDESRKIRMKTHNEYVVELFENNPNLEVVEQYNGNHNPIKHYCKKHKTEFNIRPSDALNGHGCNKCHIEKIKNANTKTHDCYEYELIEKNINIKAIGVYIDASTKIMHHCLKCGCEWFATPNSILRGSGCPKCNESRGEKNIRNYLHTHNIDYISQYTFCDCKDKKALPFDFYLPELNVCIEYDGEQHVRSIDFFGGNDGLKKRQLHDQIKTDYCKINNIPLLRIMYNENIEEKLNNFLFA